MSQKTRKSISQFHTIMLSQRGTKRQFQKSTQKKKPYEFMNPQSFNTTLHITNNITLPKIEARKRKRKFGTFLQSWLDEALGQSQTYIQSQTKKNQNQTDGGFVKTLKKFQLDKQYLQSLNIPGDRIQRLYQTLYIYSHGINKVFKEVLEFVSQFDNADILGNFWRAYTKLLQGSTSYQTIFQKVQKTHIQNNIKLQHTLQVKSKQFMQERAQLQLKLQKYNKTIQENQIKFKAFNQQYKVMQSTLGLTDQAFNDQVHLRLKFEQKINAIYTSYEQLKQKYTKIVQQMLIKNQNLQCMQNLEKNLKNQILQEKIKVDQLQNRLKRQRQIVQERQMEIIIHRQQKQDMKQIIQAKLNQDTQSSDVMQEQISKFKAMKVKFIQAEKIISGQKITIKSKQEHIQKLTKNLQVMKNKNDEIYENNIKSGETIVRLESNIASHDIKIKYQQEKISNTKIKLDQIQLNYTSAEKQRQRLSDQNMIIKRDMAASKLTRQKNQKLIDDIKAVKDKYERINEILTRKNQQTKQLLDDKSNELNSKTSELQGMKLLMDTRNKAIAQMQKQIQQERQAYKAKASALNSTLNKKQTILAEQQKSVQNFKDTILILESQKKELVDKLLICESQKLKTEVKLSGKTKAAEDLDLQLKQGEKRYQQLIQKLQTQLMSKKTTEQKLLSIEFVLATRKQEESMQIANLKRILDEYQQIIFKKSQYIHPMAFEECRTITIEAQQKQRHWKNQCIQFSQQKKQLECVLAKQKDNNRLLESKIKQLSEELVKSNDNLSALKKQQAKQRDKNSKNNDQIAKLKIQQQNQLQLQNKKDNSLQQITKKLQNTSAQLDKQSQQKQKLHKQNKSLRRKQQKLIAQLRALNQQQKVDQKQVQTDQVNSKQQEQYVVLQQIGMQTDHVNFDYQEKEEEKEELQPRYTQNQKYQSKSMFPNKKIEKKQFKKALKLTYMRR